MYSMRSPKSFFKNRSFLTPFIQSISHPPKCPKSAYIQAPHYSYLTQFMWNDNQNNMFTWAAFYHGTLTILICIYNQINSHAPTQQTFKSMQPVMEALKGKRTASKQCSFWIAAEWQATSASGIIVEPMIFHWFQTVTVHSSFLGFPWQMVI